MKVGDLVHSPHYPFWGLGMIVDREEEADGMICVYWFDDDEDFNCSLGHWRDIEDLEIL